MKTYIIEIPLQKVSQSIRIFESLNNRGKPLSLLDKLRYRTLIHPEVENNLTNTNAISKKWTETFKLFNSVKKLVKEEDFYQYFFMSKIKGEISKQNTHKYIEYYEKYYSNGFASIEKFLDESIYILKFLHAVLKHDKVINNDDNAAFFTLSEISNNEKRKTIALFELARRCIKYSKQSMFLFFAMLREHNNPIDTGPGAGFGPINNCIYKICRVVFWYKYHELNEGEANEERNKYVSILQGPYTFLRKINIELDLNDKIQVVPKSIISRSSDKHAFLLALYTYYTNFEALYTWNNNSTVDHNEVEHFMPRKWMMHWSDAKDYSREEAIKLINKLQFEHLDLSNFSSYLSNSSNDFQPKEYLSAKEAKGTNTVIEYLGNKWILNEKANRAANNYNRIKKLEQFKDTLQFPRASSVVGVNKYNAWTSQEIIERSFTIINTLYDYILKNHFAWNDVSNESTS